MATTPGHQEPIRLIPRTHSLPILKPTNSNSVSHWQANAPNAAEIAKLVT